MVEFQENSDALLKHPLCLAMIEIFEHMPDTYFFIKDIESRFLYGNRALLDRLGIDKVGDFAGTTDFDRYPQPVAEKLVAGDQDIMRDQRPLIDHPEVLYDQSGKLEWHSSSKYPIIDESGIPHGVVGITRSFSNADSPRSTNHAAGKAIDFVSANPTKFLRVSELSSRFGISERQLHRQFLDHVKLSPREFILRTRVNAAAADLRKTGESIASLAEKYQFCDQSAFTRQFRKTLGITPAKYRESYRTGQKQA